MAAPEGVNESGVAEQRAQRVPIKAQSTAVPVGTARICNAERGCLGARSGHGGFVRTLLGEGHVDGVIECLANVGIVGDGAHQRHAAGVSCINAVAD